MKTLADLKRALTVGTVVVMEWHAHAAQWKPDRLARAQAGRKIIRVQTTGVQLEGESWLTYDKAANTRILGVDRFSMLENGEPWVTYRIERDPAVAVRSV